MGISCNVSMEEEEEEERGLGLGRADPPSAESIACSALSLPRTLQQ